MVREVLIMIRQVYTCTVKVKRQNHNNPLIKQDAFTYQILLNNLTITIPYFAVLKSVFLFLIVVIEYQILFNLENHLEKRTTSINFNVIL